MTKRGKKKRCENVYKSGGIWKNCDPREEPAGGDEHSLLG